MKKTLIILLLTFLLSPRGYGQQLTRLSKFEGVEIRGLIASGAFDIKLSQGSVGSSVITVRDDLLSKLTYQITPEGYLKLGFMDDVTKYITTSKNRPEAVVVLNSLDYMEISGACSVLANGTFSSSSLAVLKMTGAAYVSWIKLSTERDIFVELSGACKMEAFEATTVGNVNINISGTSNAFARVNCQKALALVSGVSFLELSGQSADSNVSAGGTSAIEMLDFVSPEMIFYVNGLSKVKSYVKEAATVELSGFGSFSYLGPGQVTGNGAKRM